MKVLYATTISNAINDFLIPHIEQLVRMGHKVDVACNIVRKINPKLQELGVRVYNFPFRRTPFHKDNFIAAQNIKKLIHTECYDIIHTHTPVASFFIRAACRNMPDLSVLYTAHGFHFYKGAPIINQVLLYGMERLAARWTDGLITVNNEDYISASKMRLRRNSAVYLIHGIGVDLSKFTLQNEEDKLKIRKEFGFSEKDFILFFAAELNYNKHQDLLIRVVKRLKERGINVILLLAGEGNKSEDYKRLVLELNLEENIIFLGYRHDVPRLIRMADIAVSSSRREGLPVNVMEAMATGLPLVVTNCRGNRDLVENGKNGYVVGINDVEGFAKAVEELYKPGELRKELGMKGYLFIQEFALEKVLCEMREIYARYWNEADLDSSKSCCYNSDLQPEACKAQEI
ncbi:MAG TPA: glycosyltransferase family 4 protein [Clostridiales bacterium]|nr:glycosyltransferase family 4 protein [Clostridiales bacterium]